jgi:hypothetical protein
MLVVITLHRNLYLGPKPNEILPSIGQKLDDFEFSPRVQK